VVYLSIKKSHRICEREMLILTVVMKYPESKQRKCERKSKLKSRF